MNRQFLLRRAFIIGALITTLLPLSAVRAQWEDWLGGWIIYAFGACGAAGCIKGPSLCAVIVADGDTSICYER